MSDDEFRILHLSDLHFVKTLTEEGRQFGNGRYLTKSHSYQYYTHLIDSLESTLGHLDPADVLVATGDISTDGSSDARATARRVFDEKGAFTTEGKVHRIQTYGVGSFAQRHIVVPGNHDRYRSWRPIQTRSSRLEEVFKSPAAYPYVRGVQAAPSLPDILFFIFDSTQNPDLLSGLGRARLYKRTACGLLTAGDCQWLTRTCADIASGSPVPALGDGPPLHIDPAHCVRIALVHHHPLTKDQNDPDSALKACENGVSFALRCQEAGIHLVLFGHRHKFFERRVSGTAARTPFGAGGPLHLICCPTTLEYKCSNPGYLIYRITPTHIELERYEWRPAERNPAFGAPTGQGFHHIESLHPIPI
jgi:3',5'-cyclic AMP phosphodiesterase CpdA